MYSEFSCERENFDGMRMSISFSLNWCTLAITKLGQITVPRDMWKVKTWNGFSRRLFPLPVSCYPEGTSCKLAETKYGKEFAARRPASRRSKGSLTRSTLRGSVSSKRYGRYGRYTGNSPRSRSPIKSVPYEAANTRHYRYRGTPALWHC